MTIIPLTNLAPGKKARVVEFQGGFGLRRRLQSLGIRKGKIIRKLVIQPMRGPVIVEVDRMRVTIGWGMISRIMVEELK